MSRLLLQTLGTKYSNNKLFLVVKHAEDFPQSPKIATYANKIVSAMVSCTPAEKTLLLAEVTSMEAAIGCVSTVLITIQEQIESKFWLGGLCPLSLL